MNRARIIVVLVALMALTGVGAWFMFEPKSGKAEFVAAMPPQPLANRPTETPKPTADMPAANFEELITAEAERMRAERAHEAARGTEQPSRIAAPVQPAQPTRPMSAHEREELLRTSQGRPALARRMERTPAGNATPKGLSRSTDQREWEKSWMNEGINPPEMVPTPVQGKIMSEQAREGLASAVVHLMTFFPNDGVAGGPLLPVITDLATDKNGNFKGEVPGSKVAPLDFAPAAIGVTWESRRVLCALPLDRLEPGKQNALGIFWAPDYPYTLECDAQVFTGKLSVVSTGRINPARIHAQRQLSFLDAFPSFAVTPRDAVAWDGLPAPGFALLSGTSGGVQLPLISLRDEGSLIQSRVPKVKPFGGSNMGLAIGEMVLQNLERLVFDKEDYRPISGTIIDNAGTAVSGAVVSAQGGDVVQSAITDLNGWFFIEKPHEKTYAVKVWHNDFVEMLASAKPGETDLRITLTKPRPCIRLHVTDKLTTAPITELSFKVIGLHPWGKQRGKPMPEAYTSLASANGHYLLEWEYEVRSITLEKLGYFPRLIDQPLRVQDKAGGEIVVQLSPGRNLEVQPRNYSAVQQTDRWFPDAQSGPGIASYWSHHWIEYQVDFGEAPEQGEQGGFFDIVLGCTNQGIVDNQYQFTVDVFVDDVKRGTLSITADSITVREGRMRLGALSGQHRVRLMWTNDKWIPDQLDANIRYATLKFIEQPK